MHKIAHIKRTYLPKGEPFVGYQVKGLNSDFYSIVLCRNYIPNEYEINPTYGSANGLRGFSKVILNLQYEILHHLNGKELHYLLQILERERPSILHFHYAVDAGFFLNLKRILRLPAVVSCYGYDTTSFRHRFLGYGRIYLHKVFREVDCVLAMSPDMEKDLIDLGCPKEKIRIHYYGIETERFVHPTRTYENKDKIVVLIVASLYEYKGHIYLLQALKRLSDKGIGENIEVRIVGEGPLRARLERLVNEFRLQKHVKFLGFISRGSTKLTEEYRNADIYVMPSVTEKNGTKEGIPGALVEAMCSGLPVISTYHAGIPYVVEHGLTGLLVQERDPGALGHYMEQLILKPDLRAKLGIEAARIANARYDFRIRLKQLESIYRSIL